MVYLLDTNIIIALSKDIEPVASRLESIPASDVLIPVVVVAEIEFGIAKSRRRQFNRRVFDDILAGFRVAAFDTAAAAAYGPLRATLERQGTPIGPNDLLIAAQALAAQAVLVSDNLAEFSRVPRLRVENWV